MLDRADYTASIPWQLEPDHTDQECICPEICLDHELGIGDPDHDLSDVRKGSRPWCRMRREIGCMTGRVDARSWRTHTPLSIVSEPARVFAHRLGPRRYK